MEFDLVALITDGGAVGLLAAVLWKFNAHIDILMSGHREDRTSWLESLHKIVMKLTVIEKDLDDIEDDVSDIKNTLKKIEEKV